MEPMSDEQYNRMIGETILEQLGGAHRIKVMTGAYDFQIIDRGVQWKLKSRHRNRVKVTLNHMDLYDVTMWKSYGQKQINEKHVTHVYCDFLMATIEDGTGLYLSFV